jgi:hypothetical protein
VKAWHTGSFTLEPIARMTTTINFITSLLAELNARLISAYMLECGIWEGG